MSTQFFRTAKTLDRYPTFATWLLSTLAIALVLIPGTLFAQTRTCNGQINISYVSGPNFALPGDTYRVRTSLGTGTISGGPANTLTINRFRFELDCSVNLALGIPCTNDGDLIAYVDDSTISSVGCGGVAWSTNGSGLNPNQVIFTPSAPVVLPANTLPANGCSVEFDFNVVSTASGDATPNRIEEVVGYSLVLGDAQCDNFLTSGANQSAAIATCPACADDGNECTDDVCDQETGACTHPPLPPSSACTDTGNECAIAGCDGAGNCDQNHAPAPSSTSCTDTGNMCFIAGCDGAGVCDQMHTPAPPCADDGNECTGDGVCDPELGCVYENLPSSTACTDTALECSVAGCDGEGNCAQDHTPEPSSTACTDTGNECAIAGCDGAGNCDQNHAPAPSSTSCTDTGNMCFVAGCDGAGVCDQMHTPAPPCADDGNECTGDGVCDPELGCVYENLPSSTACTDTALECSVAGCDGEGNCAQDHTPEPPSTACTDTDGDLCTIAGCDGAGICNQEHVPPPSCEGEPGGAECNSCDPGTGACAPIDPVPDICLPPDEICLVIIDEDGVDNGISEIERAAGLISGVDPDELINDDDPTENGNPPLLWNLLAEAGTLPAGADLVLLPTGQVDDEGWFALPPGPNILYKDNSRPPNCGLPGGYGQWIADYIAGDLSQQCLDEVLDVMPLRNQDLADLVGRTCVAVVYDSDISMNYEPIFGNLQGARYGLFTFFIEALEVPGSLPESGSDTDLYDMWLRILPPEAGGLPHHVVIHDHEPDAAELKEAHWRTGTGTLSVRGESDFGCSSFMTLSVDGPDAGSDPLIDQYLLEEPMLQCNNGRFSFEIDTGGVDVRGRRLSIQTDHGGAYNGTIR